MFVNASLLFKAFLLNTNCRLVGLFCANMNKCQHNIFFKQGYKPNGRKKHLFVPFPYSTRFRGYVRACNPFPHISNQSFAEKYFRQNQNIKTLPIRKQLLDIFVMFSANHNKANVQKTQSACILYFLDDQTYISGNKFKYV